ncbi:hypothetical protein VCR12J2_1010057 [Vibrio coralliirubri]|nr:hypothetical protein VCR12J2_1010057 [Vibrio coralliirubri]
MPAASVYLREIPDISFLNSGMTIR